MDNPLDKPRNPENFMQDIEDLARDLAYCLSIEKWQSTFKVSADSEWGMYWMKVMPSQRTDLQKRFYVKWIEPGNAPTYAVLEAFGMTKNTFNEALVQDSFTIVGKEVIIVRQYILTEKAFSLLQKPAQAPSIFISYRHADSSALALLIEARLILAGADPSRIFIDKTIPGGDSLDDHIYKRASNCDVFICLIGSKTTFSAGSGVLAELEIIRARDPKPRIIWVCHNGIADVATYVPPDLRNLLGRVVPRESAIEYELTISYILNALDYKPYWPSPTSPFSGLGTD